MFNNLRVSTRLAAGFGAVVMLFVMTLVLVGMSLSKLTRNIERINEVTLPFILVVDEMDVSRSEVQQFITDVAATHDRAAYEESDESARLFMEGVQKFKELFRKRNDTENLRQIEEIEKSFLQFETVGKAMAEAYITQGIDAGNLLMKGSGDTPGFDHASEAIGEALVKFREMQISRANEITAGTVHEANSTMTTIIWSGFAAALLAVILCVWIVRSILRQLGGEPAYAAKVMSKIAEGDLTAKIRLRTDDDSSLLFAVKDMVGKLTGICSNVLTNTDAINTSSREIAAGNHDLSQRTEEQASSLEETSAAMKEFISSVRKNAENAKQANHLSHGTSDVAEQSGKSIEKLVGTMTAINESSRKIEDIISVIDGIAFQTNILALNAAVEAARAGEQGRGFAVVAGEVRNLAQRSASAAKEIKLLINDSVNKVGIGTIQVQEAADGIGDVVTSVQLLTSIMNEITTTSTEQNISVEQVNVAIDQMDSVTQQNAALVEQSAAAADALKEQANNLYSAVGVFKLDREAIVGKATSTVAHRASKQEKSNSKARALASPAKQDHDGDWKEF